MMKLTLIENWTRRMWTLASMRFMWVAASFAAWTAAYPDDYRALIGQLPEWTRPIVAFLVFALFGSATRLIRFKDAGDA